MKKELIFAAATTLSLFLGACNDIGDSLAAPETGGMTLFARHEAVSRTQFDGTTTEWCDGDAITVFVDGNVSIPYRFEAVDPARGTFRNGDIVLDGETEYRLHAIYPAVTVTDRLVLDIGAARQMQSGISAGHIAACDPLVGETTARPSDAAIEMKHTATVLKLTLVRDGALDIGSIASVRIEAPAGVFLYGKHELDLGTAEVSAIDGRCGNTIEVAVSGYGDFATEGRFAVWAAAAPFEIASGEKLTFTVTDEKGRMYRVDKTFATDKAFSAGKIMTTEIELSESTLLAEMNIGIDFTDPNAYPADFPTSTDQALSGTFVFSGHEFAIVSHTPFYNHTMSDGTTVLSFDTLVNDKKATIRIPRIEGYAPSVVVVGVHPKFTNQTAKIAIETSDKEITKRSFINSKTVRHELSDADGDTDYYIGIYGSNNNVTCRLSSLDITYSRLQ